MKNHSGLARTGERDEAEVLQHTDDWVDKHKPLTVVFVTNGRKFQVKQETLRSKVEEGCLSTGGILRSATAFVTSVDSPTVWTKHVLENELVQGVIVELAFARA